MRRDQDDRQREHQRQPSDDPLAARYAQRPIAPDHRAGEQRAEDQHIGDRRRSADGQILPQGEAREQADEAQYPADQRHDHPFPAPS